MDAGGDVKMDGDGGSGHERRGLIVDVWGEDERQRLMTGMNMHPRDWGKCAQVCASHPIL